MMTAISMIIIMTRSEFMTLPKRKKKHLQLRKFKADPKRVKKYLIQTINWTLLGITNH